MDYLKKLSDLHEENKNISHGHSFFVWLATCGVNPSNAGIREFYKQILEDLIEMKKKDKEDL